MKFSSRSSAHFTGLPQAKRRGRGRRHLGRRRPLRPEGAPDLGEDHADRSRVEPERVREPVARAVHVLRRDPGDQAVAVGLGEHAARLHRRGHHARDGVPRR